MGIIRESEAERLRHLSTQLEASAHFSDPDEMRRCAETYGNKLIK